MIYFDRPFYCKGQSLIESVIILPFFALLMFGVLEIAYLLHAKSTLNAATFDAARTGSLSNAKLGEMKETLAGTMGALFLRSNPNVINANKAKFEALARLNIPAAPIGRISIISPSKAVFNAFKQKIYVTTSDPSKPITEKKVDAIPNDNLMWRASTYKNINASGDVLSVNLQDANLLKIRTVWCHKLVVPFLDKFIHWTYTLSDPSYIPEIPSSEQLSCDLYAKIVGGGYYVPVTSSAIVRMQSPVLGDDLK